MLILAINPGSTSTKIGIFRESDGDATEIFSETLRHAAEELAQYKDINSQLDFRRRTVLAAVEKAGLEIEDISGFVGRGGLVRSIESGVYRVNDRLLEDARSGLQGVHASNLGSILAHSLAAPLGKEAFISDPVVVDELWDVARVTGHPEIKRRSIFHALNHKAIARKFCRENDKIYEDSNLIVAHMGGGISVGVHKKGRVVDVNNALDGDGPLSPERCGALPTKELIDLCFSGKYDHTEISAMIVPKGGFVAYFGINDLRLIEEKAQTDEKVKLVMDAMCYGIAKEIGAVAAAVAGDVDAILLTGGMAYSKYLVNYITERVKFIAPVHSYPGEDELWALASGVFRVLKGVELSKEY